MREVTRRPLTEGEGVSARAMGVVEMGASPTFIRCRNAHLALSCVDGRLPVAFSK